MLYCAESKAGVHDLHELDAAVELRTSQRLLFRIQQRIQIASTHTEIAGHNYPWIRVVNQDQLLQQALQVGEQGAVALDPFWAATWRAAVGLDRYLASIDNLQELKILELGGGSGRAGIAAALRGANVSITDASSLALLVCRYNARYVADRVRVRKLDWADPSSISRRFPLILGSDIVYDPSLYSILEPCLRRMIDSNGTVLLSEPQRHTGDRFESWIRQAGWNCNPHLIDLHDGQREIRIFECSLR